MSAARWLAAAALTLLILIAGDMASEEARARLDQLPLTLLRLARARLPAELRESVHDQEWAPELEHILKHADLFPLTRLITGLRYAAGLLISAGTVATELRPADAARKHADDGTTGPRHLAARSVGLLHTLVWPVHEPLRIRLYVSGVAAAAAAATGTAAASTTVYARDLGFFAVLMLCALAAHRSPQPARGPLNMDMSAIWFLPVAVLLPPVYALIAPAPFVALNLRHAPSPAYRRVFSAAALALSYGAVSELVHVAAPLASGHAIPLGATLPSWILLIAVCQLTAAAGTLTLILAAIKTATPATRVLPLMGNRTTLRYNVADLSLGTAVTIAAAAYPFLAILVVPATLLLRKYLARITPVPSAKM
jgi:hypothetical protein